MPAPPELPPAGLASAVETVGRRLVAGLALPDPGVRAWGRLSLGLWREKATWVNGGAVPGDEAVDAAVERLAGDLLPGVRPAGIFVRALLKGCWAPAKSPCCGAFEEAGADGSCRRQSGPQAAARASGCHCVDCPYWEIYDSIRHLAWLRTRWKGGPAVLDASAGVFLPEDFRELRRVSAPFRGGGASSDGSARSRSVP